MSSSFIFTLICFCIVQTSLGYFDLKNVAYSKKVTLSSRYHHVHYPGWNAVNGRLTDFAHSGHERSPWLRIDLGKNFRIYEIEVFARSDCCGKYKTIFQLSNLNTIWKSLLDCLIDWLACVLHRIGNIPATWRRILST